MFLLWDYASMLLTCLKKLISFGFFWNYDEKMHKEEYFGEKKGGGK